MLQKPIPGDLSEKKFELIQLELEKAASTKSLSGEICKWVAAFVAIFGSIVAFSITYETADKRGLFAIAGFLGVGLPLSAIGSNATSNKRSARVALIQAELLKLSLFPETLEREIDN